MQSKKYSPPRWCPDAVPSKQGWRHPKTGELLVRVSLPEDVFVAPSVPDLETENEESASTDNTPETQTDDSDDLSIVQRVRRTRRTKKISV
jgi:hypothetical protein